MELLLLIYAFEEVLTGVTGRVPYALYIFHSACNAFFHISSTALYYQDIGHKPYSDHFGIGNILHFFLLVFRKPNSESICNPDIILFD